MDDERYQGTVRGIPTKKHEALDYAESMARHFVDAREAGFGLNRTAYGVYFESKKLLTSNGKSGWHITMVTNLFDIGVKNVEGRAKALVLFDEAEAYFKNPRAYRAKRSLSDQDWIDLRAWYVVELDRVVDRANRIAAVIRGDAPLEALAA